MNKFQPGDQVTIVAEMADENQVYTVVGNAGMVSGYYTVQDPNKNYPTVTHEMNLQLAPLPSDSGCAKQPPIGIMPRWRHNEIRQREILRGMIALDSLHEPIPAEWISELASIAAELTTHTKA